MSTVSRFVIEEFSIVTKDTLRGFCKVRMPSGMIIAEIAVHVRDGLAWASPPGKPKIGRDGAVMRGADGKISYAPIVTFANKELRDRWSAEVIAALRARHSDALS
jgi:hypothetical protein